MQLETAGLTKSFGGVTAVDGVDFELPEGQLCSLIGPNGAGKTTFFNLLTGVMAPTAGRIRFAVDGDLRDVTTASPDEMARMGLHRSYQVTNIFPNISVLENVRIAVQAHRGRDGWHFWRNVGRFKDHFAEAAAILDRVGLSAVADRPAATLSHGEKRNLEVAIALAGDPAVLLLDEPTSGVSSEDVDDVVELIEDVAGDYTLLLIEHNMDVVMDISDRVVVLHRGTLIADGPPSDIQDSAAVRRAYLGETDETEAPEATG
ncbi:MAG: ABC transporter ATP-binding protein [Halobacteriales archaeon]